MERYNSITDVLSQISIAAGVGIPACRGMVPGRPLEDGQEIRIPCETSSKLPDMSTAGGCDFKVMAAVLLAEVATAGRPKGTWGYDPQAFIGRNLGFGRRPAGRGQ